MDRVRIMRAMALAEPGRLVSLLDELGEIPSFERLRGPERGLIMVRAKADGGGPVFNLGEALVTRCSVGLGDFQGHAYVLGDEPDKCLAAALADAMAQDGRWRAGIERIALQLEDDLALRRAAELKAALKTRVEFFTLVRGEDAE
jgi:alpha-D-ribose 1-methylphosphonate 5-triphosphate synthase subunit PhnG